LDSLLKVTMINGDVIYVNPSQSDDDDGQGGVQWGGWESVPGLEDIKTAGDASTDINGETNTAAIVAHFGSRRMTAAQVCADLVAYGFDDWYLPAAGELNEMYQKLGPPGTNQIQFSFIWSSTQANQNDAWSINIVGDLNTKLHKAVMTGCYRVRK